MLFKLAHILDPKNTDFFRQARKDQNDYYKFKNKFIIKNFIQLYNLNYIKIFAGIIK